MTRQIPKTFLALIVIAAIYTLLLLTPANNRKDSIPFYASQSSINIAHRNGHGLMPGNTIEAGLHALEMGADILEIDVHLSADKHLVVRHDPIIDTTTDGIGRISEMKLAEIVQYDAKFHEIEYPNRVNIAGIKIPALTSLFDKIPNARFLIEIKPQDTEAATRLCDTIRDYQMTEQVLVGSFHRSVLQHFRNICPEIPTSHAQSEIQFFVILSRLRLGHLYDPPGYSMQLPMTYKGIKVLSPQILESAQNLNLKVDIWTINDTYIKYKLLNMGVDGIITDRPDQLSAVLNKQSFKIH
jgi:glycerophosphoryl diester phosphodiesterase